NRLREQELYVFACAIEIHGPKDDPYERHHEEHHLGKANQRLARSATEPQQSFGERGEKQPVERQPAASENILQLEQAHLADHGDPGHRSRGHVATAVVPDHPIQTSCRAHAASSIICAMARSRLASPVAMRSVATLPSYLIRPSWRKTTLSDSSSISLMMCEVRRMVRPWRRSSSIISLRMLLETGSRPAVGSSSMSSSG